MPVIPPARIMSGYTRPLYPNAGTHDHFDRIWNLHFTYFSEQRANWTLLADRNPEKYNTIETSVNQYDPVFLDSDYGYIHKLLSESHSCNRSPVSCISIAANRSRGPNGRTRRRTHHCSRAYACGGSDRALVFPKEHTLVYYVGNLVCSGRPCPCTARPKAGKIYNARPC